MAILIPLKKKYTVPKNKSGGTAGSRTGSRSAKTKKGSGLRPRRRAYGPF